MAQLIRLESDDPLIGGLAITYPSGTCKSLHWRQEAPITEPLAAAKEYAATLLQERLDGRHTDDAERTNWPSVVAAIQAIVLQWNELRRVALYAQRQPVDNSGQQLH